MANAAVYATPRKRAFRLYRSTCVILVLAAAVLFLIIVPGDYVTAPPARGGFPIPPVGLHTFEHGWPWVFLRRQIELPTTPTTVQPSHHGPPWLQRWAWSATGIVVARPTSDTPELGRWPWFFALDAIVAGAFLFVLAMILEWRRRRRRLWQFSLGELLMLMFLCGITLSWWMANRRTYYAEVGAVERKAVSVYQWDYRGPRWLRRAAGTDSLQPLHRIVFVFSLDPSDYRDMAKLAATFPYIEQLYLTGGAFGRLDVPEWADPGPHFEQLANFPRLETLSLGLGNATDEQLAPLEKLSRLRRLGLEFDQDTSADVPRLLSHMKGLTSFSINNASKFDNRGLELIAQSPHLEQLTLPHAKINDEGFRTLARLSAIYELSLPDCQIDGRGLVHLRELPKLKWLYLFSANGIADEDWKYLAEIKTLKRLDLRGTQLTQEGVDRLCGQLPNCTIEGPN